ncbi:hypothetical protein [Asticcacaulis sp.]
MRPIVLKTVGLTLGLLILAAAPAVLLLPMALKRKPRVRFHLPHTDR